MWVEISDLTNRGFTTIYLLDTFSPSFPAPDLYYVMQYVFVCDFQPTSKSILRDNAGSKAKSDKTKTFKMLPHHTQLALLVPPFPLSLPLDTACPLQTQHPESLTPHPQFLWRVQWQQSHPLSSVRRRTETVYTGTRRKTSAHTDTHTHTHTHTVSLG